MQWHQLDHMQKEYAPCSRQMTTPTPHPSIFTGRMLFLTPSQQCQSTKGQVLLQQDVVNAVCWPIYQQLIIKTITSMCPSTRLIDNKQAHILKP